MDVGGSLPVEGGGIEGVRERARAEGRRPSSKVAG